MTALGWPTETPAPPVALGWPMDGRQPEDEVVSRETAQTSAPALPPVEVDTAPAVTPAVSRETSRQRSEASLTAPLVSVEPPAVVPGPAEPAIGSTTGDGAPDAQPRVSRETTVPVSNTPAPGTTVAADATADVPAAERVRQSAAASGVSRETRRSAASVEQEPPWPRPANRKIFVVANQKGGVGKTTSAVNLAAALAQHGARVLVIDLDPQGNASTAFDIDHRAGARSTYDVLVQGAGIADVAVAAPQIPGLDCLPATIDLAGAEIELVAVVARESRLKKALDALPTAYDYVFIDCPPSLGLLTVNALVAAHEVLIPIQCEFYALEGLSQLLRNIELVRAHLNETLHVSTILLTMYDGRTRLADQVAAEVRNHFGELVLPVAVPRSVRISEAPGYGQSVMTYDPSSRGARAYQDAARELAIRSSRPTEEKQS